MKSVQIVRNLKRDWRGKGGINIKTYPELKCSVCGYIPDEDDIEFTNYNLKKCDTCGQENVCDLCRTYSPEEADKFELGIAKCNCNKCNGSQFPYSPGTNRKYWLEEEYK